jgi:hypothetical protein
MIYGVYIEELLRKYLSIITFLIFGYSSNHLLYLNEIFDLLTNLKLLEDINLSYDNGYELGLLLNKSFPNFNKYEQMRIVETILRVNPKWESMRFIGGWGDKPAYKGNHRGLQRYKFLSQIPIEFIIKFNYYKEFQELKRKFSWYQLSKPLKSRLEIVQPPLPSEVYDKMSLENWLQLMNVYTGKGDVRISNRLNNGDINQHSQVFKNQVTKNPDKFFTLLLRLVDENISAEYLSAGLNGLIESNFTHSSILDIIKIYSEVNDKWLKRRILKAIIHCINIEFFDEFMLHFLEEHQDLSCENIIKKENKFHSIHDHMTSSINSFEGDFAELLPALYKFKYYDKDIRERVERLIYKVTKNEKVFVKFGLLRTISAIATVNIPLYAELLIDLIKNDNTGQIIIYSLQNINYLYFKRYISQQEIIKNIKKCLMFIKNTKNKDDLAYGKNLGMFLFYFYLNENNEEFDELLNTGISTNSKIIHGILFQIFEREILSDDNERVRKSKQFILRFKDYDEQNFSYHFKLTKMNNLNFIQDDFEFIKTLASSMHIRKEIEGFIDYLKIEHRLDTSITNKIFEILHLLIHNIDKVTDNNYYHSQPLIEFILELNTRVVIKEQKEEILNLIDKFLLIDKLRYSTKQAIG